MPAYRLKIEPYSSSWFDSGGHPISEPIVRHADHGCSSNTLELKQNALDLSGIDVCSPTQDEGIAPIMYEQISKLVEVPDVACSESPIANGHRGFIGMAQITKHQTVPVGPRALLSRSHCNLTDTARGKHDIVVVADLDT
jgi:hypothetical protein